MEEFQNKNANEHSVGTKVSDFKLLKELGKGSSGVVYTVKSRVDDGVYVMKKIELNNLKDKEQKDCWKEVSILKKVNHPNIIKYYTSFLEKGCLYIIMEYAENGDLYSLLKHYKRHMTIFDETDLWRIADEILLGLDYLHRHDIIHRDIKCLNLFITKDKHIKIGDLGVSKIVSNINALHCTRVGTPLYLSPELIMQIPYDFKVDLWSFGISLYHLTCLEPPFIGDNLIVLGNNIVKEKPKPIPSHYSIELWRFISAMLNKKPDKRPTAKEAFGLFPEEIKKKLLAMKSSNDEGLKPRSFSLLGNRVVSYNKSELVMEDDPCQFENIKEKEVIDGKEIIENRDKVQRTEKNKNEDIKLKGIKNEMQYESKQIIKEGPIDNKKDINNIPIEINKDSYNNNILKQNQISTIKKQIIDSTQKQEINNRAPTNQNHIQTQNLVNLNKEQKFPYNLNKSNNSFRNNYSSIQSFSNNNINRSFTAALTKNMILTSKGQNSKDNKIKAKENFFPYKKSSMIKYYPKSHNNQIQIESSYESKMIIISNGALANHFPYLNKPINNSIIIQSHPKQNASNDKGLSSNQQSKPNGLSTKKRPYTASIHRMMLSKSKSVLARPLTATKSSQKNNEEYNNHIINININLYHFDMNKRFLCPESNPLKANNNSDISLLKSIQKSVRSVKTEINLKKFSNQKNDFIFDKIIKNLELGNICKQLTIKDLK